MTSSGMTPKRSQLPQARARFRTATEVFLDAFAIDELDASMDYGEQRFQIIGHAAGKLVTVIYTERGERIRIISARQATRREHDRYYHKNSQD